MIDDKLLLSWIYDGKYRIKILQSLENNFKLSSKIALELNIHRSSGSRILKDLINKNLIEKQIGKSRTSLYFLTNKGRELIKIINDENLN